MFEIQDAERLSNSAEFALQQKGLVLLKQLPPVECRSIDTSQTDPSCLDASDSELTDFCLLEGELELQPLSLGRNSLPAVLPCHASRLASLTQLCLAHNQLVDVSGCACLTTLKVLLLGNNKLTSSCLQPLTVLSQLQVLDVHHNSLASLAPLAVLSSLAVLNAAANKLQQLPCLTGLTALTELNLRRNLLTSLVPATRVAGSPAAPSAAGAAALPAVLVRLSVAHNKLAQAGLLLPLRQLPMLADLCADGNPFGAASSSSREDVLACCPPSVIMLDMQTVSPMERVLILTTAAKINAAQRSLAAAAPAATAAEEALGPTNAAPGELSVRTIQAQQRAGKCSATSAACQEKWQQSCEASQPQTDSPQQQHALNQAFQLMQISQHAAGSSGAATAGAASFIDSDGGNQPHSMATELFGSPAGTCNYSAAAAAGGPSAASGIAQLRPSIAVKLRPHSAGDVLMQLCPAAAQAASGDEVCAAGSLASAGWPRAQSCSSAAAYSTSSSSGRGMHAGREPRILSAAAAFAAARAEPVTHLADIGADTLGRSWLPHEPEMLAEATVLSHYQDAEHEGSSKSSDSDAAAEQHAGAARALGADADAAAWKQAATLISSPAAAAAPSPAAHSARYEGALALAAVACGIALPDSDTTATTAKPQSAADAASRKCKSAWEWGIEVYGAGGDPAAAAAAAGGVADISTEELEEKYLQAQQATLADRHRQPQQRVVAPLAAPAEPGVCLTGSKLVLTGSAALRALRGEAVAYVGDVTLEHMPYSKVLAALPLLCGLSRLSALSLRQLSGLNVLPQLHPLMQLSGLRHLTVEGCPLAELVLLRPYVAFRLSGLLSFNGVPIGQWQVVAAAELFAPLEAALAVALAQAPQQAALAASGIMQSRSCMFKQPGSSSTTSSSGPAATVWCPGSSGALQHVAGSNSSSCRPVAADTTVTEVHAVAASLLQATQHQQHQQQCDAPAGSSPDSTSSSHGAPNGSSVAPASIAEVSRVFAAMPAGSLMHSARCMSQGAAFASQMLAEAAGVQQQLAVLHEQAWPGLVEQSIHEGWSGHYSTGTTEMLQ